MKKLILATVIIFCSISAMQSQKKEASKTSSAKEKKVENTDLLIKLQDGAKPKIIVDGKVFDFPIELIDQSKIASVMVLKKEEALKKYDAPNGVVIIQTKEGKAAENIYTKVAEEGKVFSGDKSPLVIIDGKVSDEKTFKKYKTEDIESIEVLKGKKAIEKYNAQNGVILIKTKKK